MLKAQMSNPKASISVGVYMGSDSDWPVMKEACEALEYFNIGFEKKIVSAHRTPELLVETAKSAESRGLKVMIAGAGGAAHLPGMLASITPLPVIGVPVPIGELKGQDALLSIVQMPKGVPVATVAIGGAWNAGLLAAQMLSCGSDAQSYEIRRRIAQYKKDLESKVIAKKLD